MNILLNLLWLIFGGFIICLEYIIGSFLLIITLVGIPFGLQTLKLGMLALSPFGRQIVSSPCTGGCLSTLMNLLWILCGGIWISITHLLLGAVCCITLIGIPSACSILRWPDWHLLLSARRLSERPAYSDLYLPI